MADIAQLERALINADAAGDVQAARTLAAEVRRMRSAQSQDAPPDQVATEPLKIGKEAFPETLRQTLRDTDLGTRNLAGAGTALSNALEGINQLVKGSELYNLIANGRFSRPGDAVGNTQKIEANKIIADEAPIGALAGNIALTAAPFAMAGRSVPAAAAIGGMYGSAQPATDEGQRLVNAGTGAAAGAAGQKLANSASAFFGRKAAKILDKVNEKAKQVAASETASARSAAGNAAQNAYRQLEHLRELGSNRALTAEESLMVSSLERELSEKALEKLMPAAAMKDATSKAYSEAMKTEAQRAAEYAADKLSKAEINRQVMARLKRYGPAVLGGIAGNLVFPGLGGAVGGAATGLVLRPTIRSAVNLAKNPAVQYGIYAPLQNSSLLTTPAIPVSSLLATQGLLGAARE